MATRTLQPFRRAQELRTLASWVDDVAHNGPPRDAVGATLVGMNGRNGGARLDGWLTDDYRKNNSWWGQNIGFIAEHLCTEKNQGDLQKLHAWIERRISAHASEIDPLKDADDRSAAGACRG